MTRSHVVVKSLAAVSAVALAVFSSSPARAAQLTPILREGQPAPGAGAGVSVGHVVDGGIYNVSASHSGMSSFVVPLVGAVTPANNAALYAGTPGSLIQVARHGNQAPGLPAGVTYSGISDPTLTRNGSYIAFQSFLSGPGVDDSNDSAMFGGSPASPTLIFRRGGTAPGLPAGVNLQSGVGVAINNAGQIASEQWLIGPGVTPDVDEDSLWVGTVAAPVMLARGGQPASGMPAGVNYKWFSYPSLNNNGAIAFYATLAGPGIDSTNDSVIYTGQPNALNIVRRLGDHAPDMAPGVNVKAFNYVYLNDSGKMAYTAELSGPGLDLTNNFGIWVGTTAEQHKVFRYGDPAPGTGPGMTFDSLGDFKFSNSGKLVVYAQVRGPGVVPGFTGNATGIWVGDEDEFDLLARQKSVATDTGGTLFQSINNVAISDDGLVAFNGVLDVPGFVHGVWATDTGGTLHKLVMTGDVVDSGGGVMKTVGGTLFTGQGSVFDGNHNVYMRLTFTDGSSGIYAVQLPEPAGMLTLAGATLIAVLRRRRRGC